MKQKEIGRKIKKARIEIGFSQNELAKHLGKTGSALGYIESGQRRINLLTLEKIARAVRKPLDYFFEQKNYSIESKLLDLEGEIRKLSRLIVSKQKKKPCTTRVHGEEKKK